MTMERLTPEDTAFLHLEDQVSAMHSVSVAVFDGPEPPYSEITDLTAKRVAYIPRFRQRFLDIPFDLERPVWVDDPHFKVGYHLRHTGLAEPTEQALQNLVGRVLSQRLDRGKPLWELWIVSNLADGQWAIISKAHHAIVDGVSGIDPLSMMVDDFGEGHALDTTWAPSPLPTPQQLLERAALDLMLNPAEQFRVLKKAARLTGKIARGVGRPSVPSTVNRAIGPHRAWSRTEIPFSEVRTKREADGISTNDVLLTYIALGLRALQQSVGSKVWPGDTATTLVPYAVGPGGVFTNEVASLSAKLPLDSDDFDKVLHRISAQVSPVTNTPRSVSASALTNHHGLAAPTIAALGVRRATRSGTHHAQAVAVNAPGPRVPVYVLGSEMKRLTPAIPLPAKVPISVGVISYADVFSIGVTVDQDSSFDAQVVTDAIDAIK